MCNTSSGLCINLHNVILLIGVLYFASWGVKWHVTHCKRFRNWPAQICDRWRPNPGRQEVWRYNGTPYTAAGSPWSSSLLLLSSNGLGTFFLDRLPCISFSSSQGEYNFKYCYISNLLFVSTTLNFNDFVPKTKPNSNEVKVLCCCPWLMRTERQFKKSRTFSCYTMEQGMQLQYLSSSLKYKEKLTQHFISWLTCYRYWITCSPSHFSYTIESLEQEQSRKTKAKFDKSATRNAST